MCQVRFAEDIRGIRRFRGARFTLARAPACTINISRESVKGRNEAKAQRKRPGNDDDDDGDGGTRFAVPWRMPCALARSLARSLTVHVTVP